MPTAMQQQGLRDLFVHWAGVAPEQTLAIGAQGSSRRYFRLVAPDGRSAVGCVGDDLRENLAFFDLDRHLLARGVRVPEIYAISPDNRLYLQQDLGDTSLYNLLHEKQRTGAGFDAYMLQLYRQSLADLAVIQQVGADFDFSHAYPRPDFDRQSILWDLNYFKYHFLKLTDTPFDEQLLENDFHSLADLLLTADTHYLLYRDFQARNIMVSPTQPAVPSHVSQIATHSLPTLYYIDFQGARRGAAQYDVASLLYSAKSNLPEAIRRDLVGYYLDARSITGQQRTVWLNHFHAYLLARILQTLGAYGFRGIVQRKEYFRQSIPLALQNLRRLLDEQPVLFKRIPHLRGILASLVEKEETQSQTSDLTLTVSVLSFSYKQGLPIDPSGNGGGFIFDCRALPNPGREIQYRAYTGKDRPVIDFLRQQPPVDEFLSNVKNLVAQSVDKYISRRFTSLQVAFGCTGGQHRSVYCAEQVAHWLSQTWPDIRVVISHREQ